MVFKAKNAHTFKLRVDIGDRCATLSTGCRVERDAKDVESIVDRWRGEKGKKWARPDVLDALVSKRIPLARAIEAYHAGTLDELLEANPAASIDLMAHVDAWVQDKRKSKRGGGQADTYKKQLAVLFPGTTLPLSLFSRKEVWARLDALEVDGPTKNRYRSAASSFAKYLVKREIIERNFVRDIEGFGENDPRLVYYEIDDAKKLIAGMDQPYAAVSALSLAFCMEWIALESAIVGDLDLTANPVTSRVRGTKRAWRDRVLPLVPELVWTLDYIKPALAEKLPAASVIGGIPEWRMIDIQRAAADELKVVAIGEEEFGQHSLHDWRHTHTVALLRWGYSEQIAADHLGHKNTTLVRERYGRFKPTKHDYAKVQPKGSDSTNSTTIPSKTEGKRGVSR